MLKAFRALADTWFGKILGFFLLIGLAGFGITGVIATLGATVLLRVGGEEVSVQDFQRAYNAQLDNVQRQTGTALTPDQALAFGVPSSVINQLANNAVLNRLADQMGMGVSDRHVSDELAKDPAFSSTLGGFDQTVFRRTLTQLGLTEKQFFDNQRKAAGREQLVLGLFRNAFVPQTALDLANRFSFDTRTLTYVTISRDSLLPIEPATDDQLQAYLTENQANYRTAEQRTISLLSLTPEALTGRYTISDAEIAAAYDQKSASMTKPERRTVEQVNLPADATVAWFQYGLDHGKSFQTLIDETQLTPTSLGTLSRSEFTDQNLGDTAFSLPADGFAIIDGVQGKRAVHVSAIEPGGTPTLEEARNELEQILKLEKARVDYLDIVDEIESARAAFTKLDQIATQVGLQPADITISADGAGLPDTFTDDKKAKIAAAVFAADGSGLTPSLTLTAEQTVWFDVNNIEPARDETLDEVRDQVAADWLKVQQDKALEEKVNALLDTVKQTGDLDALALNEGLFPQISAPITRNGDATLSANVAQQAFDGDVGTIGSVQVSDNDYIIFKVTDVTPPTAALNANQAQVISDSVRNSEYAAFVAGLRNKTGLQINQSLLNRAIGLSSSGN
ncbi:MAG: SurA N-terminal domain-containing protein [Hyphomicrobiaceae bacterium]|nr:SurA N-terminal domain-containing protein [Hyphomicrobiaceae bacterium]